MTTPTPLEIRNVALVGHKASGKTSLAEAMMYISRAVPRLGKVDDRTSVLDDASEEKEHHASFEASLTQVEWRGIRVNIVDTPGEGSFLTETRLGLSAVDAVILVVSAQGGVEPTTERVYAWARSEELPVLVVVSKIDSENARPLDVVQEIQARLHAPVTALELMIGEGANFQGVIDLRANKTWGSNAETPQAKALDIPEPLLKTSELARSRLVDDIAGTSDELTDKYLTDGDLPATEFSTGLKNAVLRGQLLPLLFTSGTRPIGIAALLDAVFDLVPAPSARPSFKGSTGSGKGKAEAAPAERVPKPEAPCSAFIWKTVIDPHAGRMSFVRVLSGALTPDMTLLNANTGNEERIGKLFVWQGKEVKSIERAIAGDIVGISKLRVSHTAHTLSDERQPFIRKVPDLPPPLFARGVRFDAKGGEDKVATALHRLAEEDPGLRIQQSETTRELIVSGLGALHLEIAVERIRRRVGIDCKLGQPHIAYKETISRKVTGVEGKHKKQSGGHGQFGVCYIDMEPLSRGGGFVFEDAIVGGSIPRQFIPSVEKGITKAMARGVLAGFPMVDVKARLFDGKYHDVDSSDAAFQMAGSKAFKAACEKAHPVLLEPIVRLRVAIPNASLGDILGDINSRRGRILGTESVDDLTVVNAFVPLSEVLEYESKLKSMTQGKGTFSMSVDHLDVCPPNIQDKVVRESGFKAEPEDE